VSWETRPREPPTARVGRGAQVGPDPRDLVEALFTSEDFHVLGETLEVQRGAPVGTEAERIRAPDLEEIRHQVELAGDLEVLHGVNATGS
jgi:hypothetical protein